jgi:hypothetical protein
MHSLIVSNIKLKSGSVLCKKKKKTSSVSPPFTITEAILKRPSQGEESGKTGRYF